MSPGVRGLVTTLNSNGRYKYKSPESVVDFLVVGGGVVGLSIARALSQRYPAKATYLVERHERAGEEISSRNSEVIHSGLYYPPESLKTRLCLRGRHLLYSYCEAHNVPYQKTGKLVVAHAHQRDYIESLHSKALKLQWPQWSPPSLVSNADQPVLPTKLISGEEARAMEPDLSADLVGALWSPETGIVDSHSFMESLEKDIQESDTSELVYSTKVVRVDPSPQERGWVVQTVTGDATESESDALLAKTLILTTGLSSTHILNALLPSSARMSAYFAKGSYASYKGPGVSSVKHLLYPCPEKGNVHFQSLGTHLTMDLEGKIRFGPDLEWLDPPEAGVGEEEAVEFWNRHLVPDDSKMRDIHRAVTSYLPGIALEGLSPDYSGIRPKLVGPNGGFQDFVARVDLPGPRGVNRVEGESLAKRGVLGAGDEGKMITLLGIESPGLTASLAIAEMLTEEILHTENNTEA